jgi:cytochrome o ubiquinol oxidase operon protein cyoD
VGPRHPARPCRARHRPVLHITTGPDNTNNVLALAFGVLIVILVVAGSLWIMTNLNDSMMPSAELMNLHMQH